MPTIFAFEQGSDTRSRPPPDSESLRYGRFRAYSPASAAAVGKASSGGGDGGSRGGVAGLFSVFAPQRHSYGSINIATGHELNEDDSDGDDDDEDNGNGGDDDDRRFWLDRMLISPRPRTVRRIVRLWYTRWGVLVLLPAVVVRSSSSLTG